MTVLVAAPVVALLVPWLPVVPWVLVDVAGCRVVVALEVPVVVLLVTVDRLLLLVVVFVVVRWEVSELLLDELAV